jgi:hypothetical protein
MRVVVIVHRRVLEAQGLATPQLPRALVWTHRVAPLAATATSAAAS